MSSFIDKLTRLRRAEPQPMGFTASKASADKPKLQMVVWMTPKNLNKVSGALDSADATLVEINDSIETSALEKICQVKDRTPGGGWIKAASDNLVKKAMDTACDFLVFPDGVPVSVIRKDKLGRILELDISLSEGMLRTVNDLPVDAALVPASGEKAPLTLSNLMLIQRLLYLVNKPVLVSVSGDVTGAELQSLWDMGVSGIVIEADGDKTGEKLAGLRKEIDNLNTPAFRKKERFGPSLPRLQPEASKPQRNDDEEEEEEEE